MKVYFDIITNHTADVIGYERGRPHGVRLQGRGALPDRRRRRRSTTATTPARTPSRRSTPTRRFPYTPVLDPAEREPQGPGLAQRRHALPQPRQHDVHRRGLAVRRLLRPRRPVHREPAGRRRDDRHLRDVDPRLRHRRLPHRHDEARQRRVLAAVRAATILRLRARARQAATSSCSARSFDSRREAVHVALHDARPHARPCSTSRSRTRRASFASKSQPTDELRDVLRRRRLVHRRRLQRLPAADVPRQPRHGPHRLLPAATTTRAPPTPSCSRATGSRTS